MAKQETITDLSVQEISKQVFLKPFSDDRPWDELLIKTELKALVQINAVSIIEIGKRLIFAKNNVEPGRWLEFLEETGIHRYTSARYMRAAQVLLERPRLKELASGISKLDEILRASDEDLQEFEDSGVFMGKTADELSAMTRKELQELIRKKDKQLGEREKRLEESKEVVSSLQEEVERLKGGEVEEVAFFRDLHNTRRDTLNEMDSFFRHALEATDPTEIIGVYSLFNQLQLNLVYLMRQLEDKSSLGGLLIDTTDGYDQRYLKQFNLEETAQEKAKEFGLVGDPT